MRNSSTENRAYPKNSRSRMPNSPMSDDTDDQSTINEESQDSPSTRSLNTNRSGSQSVAGGVTPAGALDTLMQFKDQGSKIVQEVRDFVTDAVEMIPQGTREQLNAGQQKVVAKLKEHPKTTTAVAAAVAGLGAAVVANRLLGNGESLETEKAPSSSTKSQRRT